MKSIITFTTIFFFAIGNLLSQGLNNNGADINITKNTSVYIDGVNGNIQIASGGTINLQGAITLEGNLVNNGTFILEDSASLLDNGNVSGSGTSIVKKNILNTGSHFISSPMQGLVVEDVFSGFFVNEYDEPTANWQPISTGAPLTVLKGFSVLHPNNQLIEYEGNLNSGDYSLNVTANGGGWNLVGNPYPSAMVWDTIYAHSTNLNAAIYYYNPSIQNYSYYVIGGGVGPGQGVNNGTNIIPATQGFFVYASDNGTYSTTNDARGHFNQAFYKEEESETNADFIRLSIDYQGYEDELLVTINDKASLAFDGIYDAKKIFSFNDEVPQLFAVTDDEFMAIQSFRMENNTVIPLGFKTISEGDFSMQVKDLQMDENIYVYLEDKLHNKFTNLKDVNQYTFNTIENYNTSRFALHFATSPMADDDIFAGSSTTQLYVSNKDVYIKTNDPASLSNAVLEIYNVDGKLAFSKDLQAQDVQKVTVNLASGIYLAKIVNTKSVITEKITIN